MPRRIVGGERRVSSVCETFLLTCVLCCSTVIRYVGKLVRIAEIGHRSQ